MIRKTEFHRIQGTITMLGHNHLGNTFQGLPLFIFEDLIIFRAVDERNNIRILLYRP